MKLLIRFAIYSKSLTYSGVTKISAGYLWQPIS